ncbi:MULTISPECIES: ABC-ATPase domain-containing protein [Oceanobacillus]|uniref:ABC-ATPase domain-containing protein n=1 Tax=Oceanobacillus aidingensis TaxID=645964 RepID=A0ABV9K3I2_9BACI|nr:ABC-ATPase domain-containing protein [Oceanobacillus oncorhynchi]MDM8099582.1 ABC-ATPase domain-containing protein [Oceanobacillus oncorhynchi]
MKRLENNLLQIDRKSYKAYKQIAGSYTYPRYTLYIDYVQGDPFASPSKIRIGIPEKERHIAAEWLETKSRQTAVEDAFARVIDKAVYQNKTFIKGSGKSGMIAFDGPGQEILERTAVRISEQGLTVCLSAGLPANGRSINGKEAIKLFDEVIPSIIEHSVFHIQDKTIQQAVQLADQQEAIWQAMKENNWVSFIANGSVLPRKSGVSNLPAKGAVAFQSPQEDEVELKLPHGKTITGMAVKQGVTLITGGGYHGKSTLLQAIERGVYPHCEGDGREFICTDPSAVKIRAEDGREISSVNISPFISNLPHGKDTTAFSTSNASGSTSQAANVMEALEIGADTLLIDEDTSATNFMIRDSRMQKLIDHKNEPITPFIHRIRQLVDEADKSVILVTGGSGEYFAVADTVILMEEYKPKNVTQRAQEIIKEDPIADSKVEQTNFKNVEKRHLSASTFPKQTDKRFKIQAKGQFQILFGKEPISFAYTEQLVDASQTRMIAEIIQYLYRNEKKHFSSFATLIDQIDKKMDQGLETLTKSNGKHPGDLARPRKNEIAAVLNRMRRARFFMDA